MCYSCGEEGEEELDGEELGEEEEEEVEDYEKDDEEGVQIGVHTEKKDIEKQQEQETSSFYTKRDDRKTVILKVFKSQSSLLNCNYGETASILFISTCGSFQQQCCLFSTLLGFSVMPTFRRAAALICGHCILSSVSGGASAGAPASSPP